MILFAPGYTQIVPIQSGWGYSKKYVPGWESTKQDWALFDLDNLPYKSKGQITAYYQKYLYFDYSVNSLSYIFTTTIDGGIAIYINGKKIYYFNLPKSLTNETEPESNVLFTKKIRVLPYNQFHGLNLVSIEIHSKVQDASYDFFSFDATLETVGSENCKKLTYPTMKAGFNNMYKSELEGSNQLFDGNINTKSLTSTNQETAVFTMEHPSGFNRFEYTTGNDCCFRDPVDWEIQGSTDVMTVTGARTAVTTKITEIIKLPKYDCQLSGNGEITRFDGKVTYIGDFYNDKSYESYVMKVNNLRTNGNAMQISEFSVLACKVKSCPATNTLPYSYEGAQVKVPCENSNLYTLAKCKEGDWMFEGSCGIFNQ